MNAISLFSSSGIGDLGLRANGIKTIIANEFVPERARLFHNNYPEAKMYNGDIWKCKDEIIEYYRDNYDEELFLILATPPCQGMSSNGMGKMLSDYRKGLRPQFDERNRLILPTLDIIIALRPKWVMFENVPNMQNTLIYNESGELVNIIDYIFQRLGDEYVGRAEVIDVADYGVPQNRKRLITILTRTEEGKEFFERHGSFIPAPTHSREATILTEPWITVREAISHIPPIDGRKGKNFDYSVHPLHKVPPLDDKKYVWVENTPEGETAFNNQCINPECMYQGNRRHGATKIDGINQANNGTPLYCERCGAMLPRPYTEDKDGSIRIMKGFVSAYKRMRWDEPASTLTQNFQFACSDNKIHPDQNRVLSIYEALVLQSIASYPFSFEIDGKMVSDGLIRDTIGESVPPKAIDAIINHIIHI